MIFAGDASLSFLANSKKIYVDATFKVIPPIYHKAKGQLLTLHGLIGDKSIPGAYALMPGKSETTTTCLQPF